MNMEFFIAAPGIDLIPMKPPNIVNGIGTSPSTLHRKSLLEIRFTTSDKKQSEYNRE